MKAPLLVFLVLVSGFVKAQSAQQVEIVRLGTGERYIYKWTKSEERLFTTSNALGGPEAVGFFKRPTQTPLPRFLITGAQPRTWPLTADGYRIHVGTSQVDPQSSLGLEIGAFINRILAEDSWTQVRGARIEKTSAGRFLLTVANTKVLKREKIELGKSCRRSKAVVPQTKCLVPAGLIILR